MFGSYAKGGFTDDSHIYLALVLSDSQYSFDTDVKLMTLRRGDETLVEIHTFTKNQFCLLTPTVSQIKQHEIKNLRFSKKKSPKNRLIAKILLSLYRQIKYESS
jgi:hypothetical protein